MLCSHRISRTVHCIAVQTAVVHDYHVEGDQTPALKLGTPMSQEVQKSNVLGPNKNVEPKPIFFTSSDRLYV